MKIYRNLKMTADHKYLILKASLNILSGLSLITIISLGIAYMSFNNAFVFQDIKIEITNNPVGQNRDIDFMMIGSKKHECKSIEVYGMAYSKTGHIHKLDTFTQSYAQNVAPDNAMPNHFSMKLPKDMEEGGEFRVSMTGNFVCNYLIFQQEKSQTYDNIYLLVEPR